MEAAVLASLASNAPPDVWDFAVSLPNGIFLNPHHGLIFSLLKESWRKTGTIPSDQSFARALQLKAPGADLKDLLRVYMQARRSAPKPCAKADLEELLTSHEEGRLAEALENASKALSGKAYVLNRRYAGLAGAREILREALLTGSNEQVVDPWVSYERRKSCGSTCLVSPKLIQSLAPSMEPGELWMIAGYASEGKSTLAYNLMAGLSNSGLLVSMETPSQKVYWKLACMESMLKGLPISFRDVKDGRVKDEARLRDLLEKLQARIRVVDHPAGSSSGSVLRMLQSECRSTHYDVVVVDFLGLCAQRGVQYGSQLGELLKELAALAHTKKTVVIVLHQVSRDGWRQAQKDGFYTLGALAETNAAEQTPDGILWVLRHSFLRSKVGCMKYRDEPRDLSKYIDVEVDEATGLMNSESESSPGLSEVQLPI